MLNAAELQTGEDVRLACRRGLWTEHTSGLAPGFLQANLVILPLALADDFRTFCERNPRPCPLLDTTAPGDPTPRLTAETADLRTDLPCYRVWQNGILTSEPLSVEDWWRDDSVGFLLGCSFSFESALIDAGIPVRHIELGRNVPMFRTSIPCKSAGPFAGPLVVSMRPMSPADADRATEISANHPSAHGEPIHIGSPDSIGIADLSRPDYGDAVPVAEDEVPVFWPCGVTPQSVILDARLPLVVTHKPGCMFVTDQTLA